MKTLADLDPLLTQAMSTAPDPSNAIQTLFANRPFVALVTSSCNVSLIRKAFDAVELIGDERVQSDLLFDLVTFRSVDALMELGDAGDISRLMGHLATLHPEDRRPFCEEVFDREVLEFLLDTGDREDVTRMVDALVRIGDPGPMEAMLDVVAKRPNEQSQAAHEAVLTPDFMAAVRDSTNPQLIQRAMEAAQRLPSASSPAASPHWRDLVSNGSAAAGTRPRTLSP